VDSAQIIAGLLALIGATWSALIAGFYRGDFVPGHVYRREIKRADAMTAALERMAGARRDPKADAPDR
jgi:hypothetical protein